MSKYIEIILLIFFLAVALCIRIILPHDGIFTDNWTKFVGTDPYYHMMLIDNLTHTFPEQSTFNPYLIYPGGVGMHFSLLHYLLGIIIWIASSGSPSQQLIDTISAYFPAIIGALTLIPVYFISKTLMHRWAGILSAGLLAILPGEFLGRTILGYTDHHCLEILFSTTTMMFLIMALKSAENSDINLQKIKQFNWSQYKRPVIFSILAGIFLGLYLLTWMGALLFVFIIFVFLLVQFILSHLLIQKNDNLVITGTITFLIAAIIYLPFSSSMLHIISLLIALLASPALFGISRLLTIKKLKAGYYPLIIFGAGIIGIVIFSFVSPSLFKSAISSFSIFLPSGAFLTIAEAKPILFPAGKFTLDVVWGNFTTGIWFSLAAIGIIIYKNIKGPKSYNILLIVWTLVILAATLGQRRFAYYMAVNVALLTGYCGWLILQWADFGKKIMPVKQQIAKKVKKEKKKTQPRPASPSPIKMAFGIMIIALFIFYPNIGPLPKIGDWPAGTRLAIFTAGESYRTISNGWCETLDWLREETPDPFGNPNFYYELHRSPFKYPDSVYSILAWWDYGYFISRIAHRIPTTHPGQERADMIATILLAQDEDSAIKMIQENKLKVGYAMVDFDTCFIKFHALAPWAGMKREQFFETYYKQDSKGKTPYTFFYPAYYQSLAVRLYNFDGDEVKDLKPSVIQFSEEKDSDGNPYKKIINVQTFNNYQEANSFVEKQVTGNFRLVGTSPLTSPVPLNKLNHFQLVYSSKSKVRPIQDEPYIPEVKVFKYTGN